MFGVFEDRKLCFGGVSGRLLVGPPGWHSDAGTILKYHKIPKGFENGRVMTLISSESLMVIQNLEIRHCDTIIRRDSVAREGRHALARLWIGTRPLVCAKLFLEV